MESLEVFTLNINGKKHTLKIDPSTPMLWVLRDELKMTGTKYVELVQFI
jgi:aerobic-type carbon monoxide dehydrogenase small subunit (CoxS/CutS family)